MSSESPFEPGFDPAAHGFTPAPDPKAIKPRLQRPKLSPEERAERKAAKRAARGDNGGAHTRTAQAIVDPGEREAAGRALYAEIAARKAVLIAQRQAMLDGPPYDVDKLNAELEARFDIAALITEPYDSPGNREYRKARNAPAFAYSDELDRLRREIDALSTEQIEVSWAYASLATLTAFEARRPAIEAEAKRLHAEDIAATLRQWQEEEGARFVSIIDIPDPRQREGNATGEVRESGAVRPFVRTGKLHLPASAPALEPSSSLQKSLEAAAAEDSAAQIFAGAEDDADRAPGEPQDGQEPPWTNDRTPEAERPPAAVLEDPPPAPPELPPEPPPEEPEEPSRPDPTFTQSEALLYQLAAAMTETPPGDRDLEATLFEPSTIIAAAIVYQEEKFATHDGRHQKAIECRAAFRKGIAGYLPWGRARSLNAAIEERVISRRRRERQRRQEQSGARDISDATLADDFIQANEIFKNRSEAVALWDAETCTWTFNLGPAIDRYLKTLAAKDGEHRATLLKNAKREAVERAVKTSWTLPYRDVVFDNIDYLVGLGDGHVCDLRLGMKGLRRARPEDYVTMEMAMFPAEGPRPHWDATLRKILVDEWGRPDEELIEGFEAELGYIVTGETFRNVAYVQQGGGGAGKSTLNAVLLSIFGLKSWNYGYSSKAKTLLSAKYQGHDTVLASLRNKRLVEAPEVGVDTVFGETFKILTGNEVIAGRGMRENEVALRLKLKLMISANDNIRFDGASSAYKRRLVVIPFNAAYAPSPGKRAAIKAEGPAILARMINAAPEVYRAKDTSSPLLNCKAVRRATDAYTHSADLYADFFEWKYQEIEGLTKTEQGLIDGVKRDLANAKKGELVYVPNEATGYDSRGIPLASVRPLGVSLDAIHAAWKAYAAANALPWSGDRRQLSQWLRQRGYAVALNRRGYAFCLGIVGRQWGLPVAAEIGTPSNEQ